MEREYYVYILTNKPHGALYIGVTGDLIKRIWQHKNPITKSFTSKYDVNKLVYYEAYQDVTDAITREKQLKFWKRRWKIALIKKHNPYWYDLYPTLH